MRKANDQRQPTTDDRVHPSFVLFASFVAQPPPPSPGSVPNFQTNPRDTSQPVTCTRQRAPRRTIPARPGAKRSHFPPATTPPPGSAPKNKPSPALISPSPSPTSPLHVSRPSRYTL